MTKRGKRIVRVMGLLSLAALGWFGGSAVGHPLFTYVNDLRLAPLATGDVLPGVTVHADLGREEVLTDLVRAQRTTVVVVMSSSCTTCLGELDSWNRIAKAKPTIRPLALILAQDPSYLAYVGRLIALSFPVRRVDEMTMRSIGAYRVPLVYELDSKGHIRSRAVGVAAAADARTRLGGT